MLRARLAAPAFFCFLLGSVALGLPARASVEQAWMLMFETGSAELTAKAAGLLREASLRYTAPNWHDPHLCIEGHADLSEPGDGTEVSRARADAVATRLIELGWQSDKLTISSFGSSRLLALGGSPQASEQNRRVIIWVCPEPSNSPRNRRLDTAVIGPIAASIGLRVAAGIGCEVGQPTTSNEISLNCSRNSFGGMQPQIRLSSAGTAVMAAVQWTETSSTTAKDRERVEAAVWAVLSELGYSRPDEAVERFMTTVPISNAARSSHLSGGAGTSLVAGYVEILEIDVSTQSEGIARKLNAVRLAQAR